MPLTLAANVVIADRFRLNHQLGRGGMGSVWHATHLGLDIPCAVKFIEGSHAALPEAHARFEREAKAAAQLRSPHVVQVLDHGVCEDTPYIAMELLDGEDLGKRLIRLHRMPAPDVLRIVSQVGRALTRAHAVGIVHRDLKPDNIFLVRDDDREIAKVLDFGIAKATGSTAVEGSATKTGAMLGTPYYMSPEQAQGIRAVDHRSDLWSLGVIVFQALTGKLPFESEALGDLLVQLIVAPVPVPSQIVQDLPAGFDAWYAKAAQREPGLRFQSAKEFTESLGLALGLSSGGMAERPIAGGSVPPPPNTMLLGSLPQRGSSPPPPQVGTLAITPPPVLGTTPAPTTPAPTTGGPMSRTFGGGPPSVARSSTGLFVALGGVGLVVIVLAIVGVGYAMKGKGTAAVTAGPGIAQPMVAPPTVTATATAMPAVTLEPPASTPSAAIAAPPASVSATSAKPAAVPIVTAQPVLQPVRPTPVPAASGKKKPVDLGI